MERVDRMAFCRICGSEILAEAEICPKCGVRQQTREKKNPGVAAIFSVIWPGLGQIFNGQTGKGILFILLQMINFFLLFFIIGAITIPGFWVYGIYDAYLTAEKINRGEEVPKKVSINF